MAFRLDPHLGEVIDRNRRISFRFEGKNFIAYAGETIGSALGAAGVEIFSRSFKYHRPRGLLCVEGKCPNCLMSVNGAANVRVCTEPVREGDVVEPQHCWPSLQNDFLSFIEKFDFLLPVGFYYKMLFKHRFMWKIVEPLIRRLAGLGSWSKDQDHQAHGEHEYLHTDLTVLGGGLAGLAAAKAAAEVGVEVLLVDDQSALGGRLRAGRRDFVDPQTGSPRAGFMIARDLSQKIESDPRIQILRSAVAVGGYEGGLLAVQQGNRLFHVRTAQTIVATGTFEYPPLFQNNDLPGIMLGQGVLRLLHLYSVKPGHQAVVATQDEEGLSLALDLSQAGVRVAAVIDARAEPPESEAGRELQRLGIPHLTSYRPVTAQGRRRVHSVTVARIDSTPSPGRTGTKTFSCDLICVCSNRMPALEIYRQNGGRVRYNKALGQMVPDGTVPNFWVAGEVTGFRDLSIIWRQGRTAGLEAANQIHPLKADLASELRQLKTEIETAQTQYRANLERQRPDSEPASDVGKKQFVCLCEDVTRNDLSRAAREGFDEMELLKRYTTLSMGPCQGRMCLMPGAICAAVDTKRTLEETGTTASRPPVFSIPLGVVAGPPRHPVKLTPMHYKHIEAGAKQMDMGEWKRPHTYLTPEEEWTAVRERVGLIDVSTLGKVRVQGRDAARLLDRTYTHIFSSLETNRSRYGVICSDDGIILDDGTVNRLGQDDFYITTTTGNVEFVEKWLKWWLAGTGWCAHVCNVTADYAAVNLAGPRARDVLRKLTELDVSTTGFRYMKCAQGEVAGVPSILLRIGFVGETGWEIHYPACYGEYLWDAVFASGQEFGIRAFGVEAQRILRLEKKHVIVGQDTDALSTPLEADMEWVVKYEKEDFIGKPSLLLAKADGFENKLIGFIADEPVEDGSAVVMDHKPVGRVTSARVSPHHNLCIGLAIVPSGLCTEGSAFEIRNNGRFVKARVYLAPFYDPEGVRLKE